MAPTNIQIWFKEYKKIWHAPFQLEEFLNLHAEDVLYDDLTIPKVFKGHDELREFYIRILEAVPNFSSRYDRFYQQGDVLITEGALVGDQTKPYRGNPPSNKHFEVPWVQFLLFREEQICEAIGADWLVYQDLEDLTGAIKQGNPSIEGFDASVFTGKYITGDIGEKYLNDLQTSRSDAAKEARRDNDDDVIDLHNTA